MKQYIKSILPAAALMLGLGMTSCVGDLDVEPIDPSTTMTPDANGLFLKCYANMAVAGQGGANGDCDIDGLDGGTTGFVRQLFNANELTTDESICCWGDPGIPAFNFNQYDASHPMLRGFYYRLYAGVTFCNHYLEVCGDYDKSMTADVRFLRALYFYHLMDCYGNIAFPLSVSDECAPQKSRAEVFAFIENELKEIRTDLLPAAARTSKDNGYGRVDQNAVDLLLARLYLNAEVYTGKAMWTEAKQYAKAVVDGPHKLWDKGVNGWSAYQMLFMGDNGESGASQEAILPILQDGKATTSWGTTLFLLASTVKSDMTATDGGTFGTTEAWAGNRTRPEFVAKFFPNGDAPNVSTADMVVAAGDDRALLWGVDRINDIPEGSTGEYTNGFAVAKFSNRYSNGGSTHSSQYMDADYFLMRSAEAYLILAEADARLNGGTTSAEGTAAIKAIRSRAHASTAKSAYTTDDILDERARELYYEGFRRTDLIRYGYYNSPAYRWQWKGGAYAGVGFDAHLNVFAIPSDDLEANKNLKQNPGY